MSKQLKSPLFILMHGMPAAGKSAFARQYAEALKIAHLSSDRLRYELYDDAQFSPSENKTVFRLASYTAKLLASQGQSLIFDMNLPTQHLRNEMKDLALRSGLNFLIVWVQTNMEVAMRRAASRDRRRPDDKYSPSLGSQLFERIASKTGYPNPDRETVAVVSGQQAFTSQQRLVDHRLKQLRFVDETAPISRAGRVDLSRRTSDIYGADRR